MAVSELGIPYQGKKSKIAKDIIEVIKDYHKDMTDFYDLCGGGGCITFTAQTLLKNVDIHYNDIKQEMFNIIDYIINVKSFCPRWLHFKTREEFFACRDKTDCESAITKLIWSFGTRGISGGYLYGKHIVRLKELGHLYSVLNDSESIKELQKEYGLKVNDSLHSLLERRLEFQTVGKNNGNSKCQLEHLQRLEKISDTIESFNQYSSTRILATNKSYEEVEITGDKPVLYLDIPYKGTKFYDGIKFDYEKFYEWVRNCPYPVYFSEYEAPDDFKWVWEKDRYCAISSYETSRMTKTEKLFWNGVK